MRYPTQESMTGPLLRLIYKMGGRIKFSVEGDYIEQRLGDEFGLSEEERNYADKARYHNTKGGRKWRNHIQWVRNLCVEYGFLGTERDIWELTPYAYENYGWKPPEHAPG